MFFARSSVNLIPMKKIWLMAVFQTFIAIYFLFEAIFAFTFSIWIIFALIFLEGFIGGIAYVNTYFTRFIYIQPKLLYFVLYIFVFIKSFISEEIYDIWFTFRISKEVPMVHREFTMSVVVVSGCAGITISGFMAIPTHNWICSLPAMGRLLNY
jgi:battenin